MQSLMQVQVYLWFQYPLSVCDSHIRCEMPNHHKTTEGLVSFSALNGGTTFQEARVQSYHGLCNELSCRLFCPHYRHAVDMSKFSTTIGLVYLFFFNLPGDYSTNLAYDSFLYLILVSLASSPLR